MLITPPFTQLNTPYPATAYLKGFLNTKNISSFQLDLGIDVILELFTEEGLRELFNEAERRGHIQSENGRRIFALREDYCRCISIVIPFLQGKTQTMARLICSEQFLPRASRFEQVEELDWAFGSMGLQDQAKHLATLYLEDLSDFIVECVDPHFGFSRYAERLGRSANSFDELHDELCAPPTYIDELSLSLLHRYLERQKPKLVCFSVPFPGNLYSALRCAQHIKNSFPDIKTAMGGGFPNTELRSVKDPRVFSYIDFITLDDGERPIELIAQRVIYGDESAGLKRSFLLEDGQVRYRNDSKLPDYKQSAVGTPDYSDLRLDEYISVIEVANPMHSLWSDGRWNKLTMAHGCYWGKCSFCDVSLDYIKIYEPIAVKLLADRMEQLIEQTGERGFHFVDEAAPPALMRELALEILRRGMRVSWWTNIRFEKSFSADLCQLLSASGCIAFSGGLEVASDRLLKLIEKGVTVKQVAQVCRNLTAAGIMVHAYLMYGYPTQNEQETIDSLEMVRQLFELGVLQSGFWHRFALTVHSPIGQNPKDYGIIPEKQAISFAQNDVGFTDSTGVDHEKFSFGLRKSLFNYMHGLGFEWPLQDWFDFKVPKTQIKPDHLARALEEETWDSPKPSARLIWLHGLPASTEIVKRKKGRTLTMLQLEVHRPKGHFSVNLEKEKGDWLLQFLQQISRENDHKITWSQAKESYEQQFEHFELFWHGKAVQQLRKNGLLVL